ncbi:Antisense-enhancing sequence 1 [Candida maltosa Xu316]|uniref:Antisense-enhancing sequence 1 n=1 Tax=Candida maltosa (strain Xu316) TaxID=1245528 RepID=M3INR2_CANMX|nr:Antisense-enhancing sequence 1 [Candida maltosa Xu316]
MPQFKQVDVFTDVKYKGNPVAVIFDADGLTTDQMQDIARWTNLSETTFVVKPQSSDADYGLRIFTPGEELPFAGHPTLGSAFALLEDGLIAPKNGKVIQDCKAGLVEISIDESSSLLEFKLPYAKSRPISEETKNQVQESLGKTVVGQPVLIETGPKWAVFEFMSADDVLNLNIDLAKITELSKENDWTGIEVFGKHESGKYELRNIAPIVGVAEDPACGSGSGALGAYLSAHKKEVIDSFEITQGRPIGRDAKIRVRIGKDDGSVFVGGNAVTCFSGTYSI